MKKVRSLSFQLRVFLWITLIYVAVLVFSSVVIFGIAIPSLRESKINAEQEIVRQAGRRLDDQLARLNAMGTQAAYSSSIRKVLEKRYNGNTARFMDYMQDEDDVFRYFQDASRTLDGVVGVYIYNEVGYMYYYSSLVTVKTGIMAQSMDWYRNMLKHEDPKYTFYTNLRHPPQIQNSSQFTISMIRNLRNVDTFTYYGQVEVQLLPQAFHAVLQDYDQSSLRDSRHIILMDGQGQVIYSSANQYQTGDRYRQDVLDHIHEMVGDREQFMLDNAFISVQRVGDTGWHLAVETDDGVMLADIYTLSRLMLLFACIAAILVLLLGALTANELTKPVKELQNKIKAMEQGDFDTEVHINSSQEFNSLAESFNDLSIKLKEYFERIRIVEREKRDSEIIALQAQINPHFTLNTINTIKYLAALQNADNIVAMLNDFSLLLQVALTSPMSLVTVEEEVSRIQAFFRIQEISAFGKIKLALDIAPETRQCCTMSMLLQPLVENAIFHGIKPKMEQHQLSAGVVRIKARLDDPYLTISIADDGVGMTQQAADQLLVNADAGIGVYNVSQRIRLRFGEPYGMTIQTTLGEGCTIVLKLPVLHQDGGDQAAFDA